MKIWFLIGCGLLILGCAAQRPWRVNYLTGANNLATQDEVMTKLGPADRKDILSDGKEVWLYRYTQSSVNGTSGVDNQGKSYGHVSGGSVCAQYILTFGTDKVLHDWIRQTC